MSLLARYLVSAYAFVINAILSGKNNRKFVWLTITILYFIYIFIVNTKPYTYTIRTDIILFFKIYNKILFCSQLYFYLISQWSHSHMELHNFQTQVYNMRYVPIFESILVPVSVVSNKFTYTHDCAAQWQSYKA